MLLIVLNLVLILAGLTTAIKNVFDIIDTWRDWQED